MISNLESIFSTNAKGMKRSAIRELLKLTADPEIISFAGGLPSPQSFQVEELKEVIAEVMENEPAVALQYGSTEGDPILRQKLVERYQQQGLDITLDNLVITTASQQALDLVAKIFVNRGDKVLVGKPSYLGGLGAFNAYGADLIGVDFDENGMSAIALEKELESLKQQGIKPKFIYIIPDFQNPAGITMPESRRIEIIELAHKYDVLIVEDSPYRELRFEGEHQKTMYALDNTGHVITLGTFSKIFVPGFRIGWVIAHPDIVQKFVIAKQSTDLCTPPFTQRIAARYLEKGLLDSSIEKIIAMYQKKKALMLDLFDEHMPEGVTWTKPEGGLFLFVTLPENISSLDLFEKAIKNKVAFVTGNCFFADDSGKNTMRINFSYVNEEKIIEGVKRLCTAIKEMM